jgi:hypothetical protein
LEALSRALRLDDAERARALMQFLSGCGRGANRSVASWAALSSLRGVGRASRGSSISRVYSG